MNHNAAEIQDTSVPGGDSRNPWVGLNAFTEEQHDLFFGRDEETDELYRRIKRKRLTVLFGQSGLGKTSLLQAGLFPRLRRAGFLPVSVRIRYDMEAPPPTRQVVDALRQAVRNAGQSEPPQLLPNVTLWEYFHQRDFRVTGADGRNVIVILAFDQFEEVFTLGRLNDERRAQAQALLDEFADLIENRAPPAVQQRLESDPDYIDSLTFERDDLRVLCCLREDYLPNLEDMRSQIPAIAENRMRLMRMNGRQALAAVEGPGGQLLAAGVGARIVRFVAGGNEIEADGDRGTALDELEVDPAILSLFCHELDRRRRVNGENQITVELLKGSHEQILEDFYERCVSDQHPAVRSFIEEQLLAGAGFRENVSLDKAREQLSRAGAPAEAVDTLVHRRLLQVEERQQVRRVELTHDVLTDVVRRSRDDRREAEVRAELWRSRRRLAVLGTVFTIVLTTVSGLALLSFSQYRIAKDALEKLRKQQLESAERAWDSGDASAADELALTAHDALENHPDDQARCMAIHHLAQGEEKQARTALSLVLNDLFNDVLHTDASLNRVELLTRRTANDMFLECWIDLCDDDEAYEQVLRFSRLPARIDESERDILRTSATLEVLRRQVGAAEADMVHVTYMRPRETTNTSWKDEYGRSNNHLVETYQSLSNRPEMADSIARETLAIDHDCVKAALKPTEAIVHFVLARRVYSAWVLKSNQKVVRVSLGSANEIEEQLRDFTRSLRPKVPRTGGGTVIPRDFGSTDISPVVASSVVKRLVWDALSDAIGSDVNRLYIVPDGIFHTVPISAIPITDDQDHMQYMIDRFTIVHLLSPGELLESPEASRGKGVLLVGGVDYGTRQEGEAAPRLFANREENFSRLGTQKEVETIRDLIAASSNDEPSILDGANASEQAIRTQARGCRVLHLATHGWATHDLKLTDGHKQVASEMNAQLLTLDPSLLSGVALADANGKLVAYEASESRGLNDGLLTSMETAGVDMQGVDLIVLSACDTVSRARAGNSFASLVNAYQAAGAKAVVASLYPISDDDTTQYMRAFYDAMLARRYGPAVALRQAALELKAKGKPPSVWSAFVSYGKLETAPFVHREDPEVAPDRPAQ